MMQPRRLLPALLISVAPTALAAQATIPNAVTPPTAEELPADGGMGDDEGTITVTGQRQPGTVMGDVPPEVQLSPADIRSYGVSSVTDLLNELAPQTGSGRGRGGGPVVLLNGRRISGMSEIRDLPTEAIQRVDILPEEVALKYGYPANQKVVNIVLRRRFRAVTVEGTGTTSTEGGGETGRGEFGLLRINGDGRLNLNVDYRSGAALRESQRDILPARSRQPFSLAGNVTALPGSSNEIDPALSAIVGQAVTVAGVPLAAASGPATLAQFATNANVASATDVRRYRTLRAATDQLDVNAVLNRNIFENVSATVNATFGATGSDGLRGLPGAMLTVPAGNTFSPFNNPVALYRYVDGLPALSQSVSGETAHAGVTLNGTLDTWQWTVTGNYDRSVSRTRTTNGADPTGIQALIDGGSTTLNPFGPLDTGLIGLRAPDRARAVSNTGDVQAVASGTLLAVPAGDLSTTLKIGAAATGFDTRSTRSGLEQSANLSRQNVNGQLNLDLPITSRRNDFLSAVGDVSANFNVAADHLSDFGTLSTIGYGLTWKPRDRISLIWSVTDEDGAPSVQQLGNPQVATSQVRVFDYLRGTTVDVTRIDGGNPALLADNRRVTKLGVTLKPFDKQNLSLTANYVRTRTRNSIATLPSPTAAIEAAFADRFVRDADGTLLRIDNRPVNFAEENSKELRWGFNFSLPLKSSQWMIDAMRVARERRRAAEAAKGESTPDAAAVAGALRDASPAGRENRGPRPQGGPDGGRRSGFGGGPGGPGGGPGGPGGFGGRGPQGGGGRLQFAAYHTWLFQDEILIRQGLPVLDLLNGAASGAAGGQPRHVIEAQAGITNNGLGARISANWQSGTVVRGGTGASTGDLRFSDLTTANLRLFANLSQLPSFADKSWARGMRVSFSVTNLFNQRLGVRDASGATPLGYQPAYLDPIGREVRISIRKLIF